MALLGARQQAVKGTPVAARGVGRAVATRLDRSRRVLETGCTARPCLTPRSAAGHRERVGCRTGRVTLRNNAEPAWSDTSRPLGWENAPAPEGESRVFSSRREGSFGRSLYTWAISCPEMAARHSGAASLQRRGPSTRGTRSVREAWGARHTTALASRSVVGAARGDHRVGTDTRNAHLETVQRNSTSTTLRAQHRALPKSAQAGRSRSE